MQYRTFGRLDWRVSALGFGAMRLPVLGDEAKQIDAERATEMLHTAIDGGVNYVDTAYGYHGGKSEGFLGQALQGGYRQRVMLATKLPCWLVEKPDDFDRLLNEQLERLQVPQVDFYLFHALNGKAWPKLRDLKALDWAERAMADGRIGHLGFSFHDSLDVFQEIVDGYDGWTLAQIQYNYMDTDYQAGTQGLRYAAGKGLAVVVMEPIRGGMLARTPPAPILKLWDQAPVRRSPAEWALQWVWQQPEVSVVLSGMSTLEQVVENLSSAARSGPALLTVDDLALVDQVRDKYRELAPIPCTGCQYCLPCPSEVAIPRIFEFYNDAMMYNDLGPARLRYSWLKEEERASACEECGACEALCPQAIEIIEWLKKAGEVLGQQQ
jgi:hypothetical protein